MAQLLVRGRKHSKYVGDELMPRRGDVVNVYPDSHQFGTKEVQHIADGKFYVVEVPGPPSNYRPRMTAPLTETVEIIPADGDTPAVTEERVIARRQRTLKLRDLPAPKRAEINDHSTPTQLTRSLFDSIDSVRPRTDDGGGDD